MATMKCPSCGATMQVGGRCPSCGYSDSAKGGGKKAPAKKAPGKTPAKKGKVPPQFLKKSGMY